MGIQHQHTLSKDTYNHCKLIQASRKMKVFQILLLTAMVAIAMEKCVAKYLLVEIEDEIVEREGSMFNSRTTNECSWSKWSECSESCGNGFMERVRTNTAGKSGKDNCIGLPKETKRCQIRNNNCELKGYTYKPNYTCVSGSGNRTKVSIKSFDRAVELCNEDSSCRCINDSRNDEVYSLWTGKTPKACSDCTAWIKN